MRGTQRLAGSRGAWSAAALVLALAGSVRAESPAAAPVPAAPEEAALEVLATSPEVAGLGLEPEGPALEPPSAPGPPVSRIEQAWQAPAPDLAARVRRTRQAAVGLGAWSLDAAARALAVDDRLPELERAEAAVALAPDLPAAHMWRAELLWLRGGSPMAAIRAAFDAMAAAARHVEASLWFAGSGLYLLAVALVAGGLLAIALAGAAALPHAAHDLGHGWSASAPGFARVAALGALLLVPIALGEGVSGLALGLFAVAVIYGRRAQRTAMLLAAAGIGLGAHPVIASAGAALGFFPGDPVARAAYSVSQGVATPVDLARLETAAPHDPLATRGLAIQARRTGRLGEADALYQDLLERGANDAAVLNNAANVRLDLGQVESALALYAQAADPEDAVVLFNLAQAYGRGFKVEDLNRTLARAQELDGDRVTSLTALQSADAEGFVVDVPLGRELFWQRLRSEPAGAALAAEFRAPFAPGRLGRDPALFAGLGALVWLIGSWVAARGTPSRRCARCGDRVCRRCDPHTVAGSELCEGCHRLFHQPAKTNRVLRAQRVNELRARELRVERVTALLSLLVPGAAGLIAQRPLRCWLGALCFALAIAAWLWRDGVVPDPLVAGSAAPVAFLGLAFLSALVYAVLIGASLASRKDD